MKFRTELPAHKPPFMLSADTEITLIGSCFTDNMGERLASCGISTHINPCGVQYNPLSIAALIQTAATHNIPEELFFHSDGLYRCWLMPTRFSALTTDEIHYKATNAIESLYQALVSSDTLILTMGTAWVYEHIPSDTSSYNGIVANCHKVKASEFSRRRLSVAETIDTLLSLLNTLASLNPSLRCIFTVSPIRHFKDGAHENTLSKATLHLAADSVCSRAAVPSDYFPAYELLIDDLRDYRFYATDMLHPSPSAIEYIWEYFTNTYFSAKDRIILESRRKATLRQNHRPIIQ